MTDAETVNILRELAQNYKNMAEEQYSTISQVEAVVLLRVSDDLTQVADKLEIIKEDCPGCGGDLRIVEWGFKCIGLNRFNPCGYFLYQG